MRFYVYISMQNLIEIIKLFFRLGVVAFGGPAAHIAIVHKEVVEKRKWMDEDHFVDLMGATSLIPGPNSTEMVIHCGYHRGGLKGLFAAGLSFVLPATVMTGILAYFYVEYKTIPNFENYIIGIKPIVIILILDALRKLYKKAIKTTDYLIIAIFVAALGFTQIGEVQSLLIGAFVGFSYLKIKETKLAVEPISIFLIFFKIGSVLFGSGYVLIAFVQNEFVIKRGWLTSLEIADAIGIGQFTPGPVLSTSTFIGYLLGGGLGAVLATVGIFLPSFLLVYLVYPLIPKLRASKNFSIVLNCVNAGSLGLMAYALYPLGRATFLDLKTTVLFFIMGVIYLSFKKLGAISLVSISLVLGFLSSFINF